MKNTFTPQNETEKAKVQALKKISDTKWTGNVTHDTLDKCLRAISTFFSGNSGWYNPRAVRIGGVKGIFMLNSDDTLFCECRVVKKDENKFVIEHLTKEGWNMFENMVISALDM